MAHNKIVLAPTGEVLIDLTQDDVTEADVVKGKTFHKADGTIAEGAYEPPVAEVVLQDKTITENGTYTADEGYDGLGSVTVDVDTSVETEELTVELSMADGDQIVSPSENKLLSKVTVTKPATMLPENIKEGVEIGGVVGTHGGGDDNAFTLQDFIDVRGLYGLFLNDYGDTYLNKTLHDEDIAWLSSVDTSKCTKMDNMFKYNKYITTVPLFDTSNVVSMSSAFGQCTKLSNLPLFNTSKVTTFANAFQECRDLKSIPHFDTSSALSLYYAFYKCGVTEIPMFNTSKVNNWGSAFYASGIKIFPPLDMSSATSVSSLFEEATALQEVPSLNIPKASSFTNMFRRAYSLKNVRKITNSISTSTSQMFQYDSNLITVEEIDMKSVTGTSNMFASCSALTNIKLKNIQTNLQVGSGTSYGHLLTIGSLIGLCYECRDTGSSKTLTVGSANLTKLSNVYVKTIDITDDMVAADDLVSEKAPFEAYVVDPDNAVDIESHVKITRISSTDELPEGASLITNYMPTKNWNLQ